MREQRRQLVVELEVTGQVVLMPRARHGWRWIGPQERLLLWLLPSSDQASDPAAGDDLERRAGAVSRSS